MAYGDNIYFLMNLIFIEVKFKKHNLNHFKVYNSDTFSTFTMYNSVTFTV